MSLIAQLLAVFVPPACAACRAPVAADGPPLCPACLRSLPWLPQRCCARCGLPRHKRGACPAAGVAFATAWAPLAYEGVARDVITALKFRSALALAPLMAAQIVANAPAGLFGAGALVPVPAGAARARRRGFDPAALLAAAVAARTGLPVAACLRRRGRAPRQVGASRRERRAGGRLEIEVAAPPPQLAVLVDDVHTTGATLHACARALRAGGCERVQAVSYARTL